MIFGGGEADGGEQDDKGNDDSEGDVTYVQS